MKCADLFTAQASANPRPVFQLRAAVRKECHKAPALPPENKPVPGPSSMGSGSVGLPDHAMSSAGSRRSSPVTKRWQAGLALVSMTNCLIFFNEKMILHLSNDREIGGGLQ